MTKLRKIFITQNKIVLLSLLLILSSTGVDEIYARDIKSHTGTPQTVKGTVRDKKTGEALIGVLIKEDASHWTVSDENGTFALEVTDATPTLDVALPGYQLQQVAVSDPSHSQTIELVEATFSFDNNASKTSTISKIGADVIEQEQSSNTINTLNGRISGVTVENGRIKIRGQSNVQEEVAEPLLIIDGVQLPPSFTWSSKDKPFSPLNLLNVSSIESIEILKDSDATAIYGSKGANGVVIINTKKIIDSKLRVSASAGAGVTGVTEWYDFLSTEEYLDIRNKAFDADVKLGISQGPTEASDYDIFEWGDKYHTDWQKEFVGRNGKVYNGNVGISGGTNKTSFYINTGYFETGNVLLAEPDDKTKRINTKLLVNHRTLNDKLDLTASFSFNTLNSKSRGLDPDSYLVNPPNQPAYNPDGSLYWLPDNADFVNPLRGKYTVTQNKDTDLIGNLQAHYRFLPNFDAVLDLGYTKNTADQFQSQGQKYWSPYANPAYKNRVFAGDSYAQKFIIEPRVTWNKSFKKNSLTALLGVSYQLDDFVAHDLELRDFPTEQMFRNYATAAVKYSTNSNSEEIRRASAYVRVSYDYDSKYIFSGIIRRDGSSIFDEGNRYGNFWSIAGAWVFSGEEFFRENLSFLNYGKLKISHGLTGNDNVTAFQYINAYAVSTYPYEGSAGLYLNRIANPDFSWEKNKKSEIFLDLAFWDNRFQLTSAFYLHRSNSLLGNRPMASQVGLDSFKDVISGAILQSRGIELDIIVNTIRNEKFKWTTSLILTIPDNQKIIKFPNLENTSYSTKFKVGESINVTRLYKYTGINPENGAPTVEDINGDGSIDATNDRIFQKDTDPDFHGGFHNSFRYKNLQLDVFFNFERRPFSEGYLQTYYYPLGYRGKNIPREFATDYWTPENPNASRPGLTTIYNTVDSPIGYAYWYHYTESDASYSDASYIRLKNVALSYTLPKLLTSKLKARNIRVYVRGENLWTLSKFDAWDPETKFSIPPFRTVTAGLTLSF
jgi:TonB-linked SusC/RagA family outer membrane protein